MAERKRIEFPTGEAVDAARRVGEKLRDAGFVAYFVGGCVRDSLLGAPIKDVDVATSATPGAVEKIFRRAIPVGEAFGVMMVLEGGHRVEVATFRKESGYANRRHPSEVEFSSADEDVKRRDFTINGLFYDFATGEVVDYVGGLGDLESRTLRAIGVALDRFNEDALRLMRAVRFAGRYNLRIEDETWQAMKTVAPHIAAISKERIGEEWSKGLESAPAPFYIHFMARSGLLPLTLSEVAALEAIDTSIGEHALETTARRLKIVQDALRGEGELAARIPIVPASDALATLWAALLFEIGRPLRPSGAGELWEGDDAALAGASLVPSIAERLSFSRATRDFCAERLRLAPEFHAFDSLPLARRRELLGAPGAASDLLLLAAYREVFELSRKPLSLALEMLQRFDGEEGRDPLLPPPLVDGVALMASCDLKPGRLVGHVLAELRRLQLEGTLATPDHALEFAAKFIAEEGHRFPARRGADR